MNKSAKNAKNATSQATGGQMRTKELRSLPQAPEAEYSTLGAMLMSQDTAQIHDTITRAFEIVEPGDFYHEATRTICQVISELFTDEIPVDLITVTEALRNRNRLEAVGGAAFLTALIESCPSAANVASYANLIRETSYARKRLMVLSNGLDRAFISENPREVAQQVVKDLQQLDEYEALSTAENYSTDLELDALLGAMRWLWPGWIWRGYVTALVARQEAGKSNVALDLCRRIITGAPWPDGTPTGISPGSRLLWIDTEMALGAFLQRIKDWGLPRGHFILPQNPLRQLQLDQDADWKFIQGAIARYQPPLVIIDSLSGGHRGEEKDNDFMKGVLLKLSLLAQTHKIGVVIIHHLRKNGPGEPDWPVSLDMVRGAGAITQLCRSVLALGVPDKTRPEERRADVIKSNYALKAEPLGFTVTGTGLVWGPAPEPPSPQKPVEEAHAYLLAALQNGPRLAKEMREEVMEKGICSSRTYDNAVRLLRLKSFKEKGQHGRWFVALPNWRDGSHQNDSVIS